MKNLKTFRFRVKHKGALIALALVTLTSLPILAQYTPFSFWKTSTSCAPVTVSASGALNTYAYVSTASITTAGPLTVDSSAGFIAGDTVMLHQTQGPSAGHYETFTIASVTNGTTLTLSGAPAMPFFSGTSAAAASIVTQLIKVAKYCGDLTIDAGVSVSTTAFTGQKGGIIVIQAAGEVTLNGTLDVSASGFGGGASTMPGISYNGIGAVNALSNRGGGGSNATTDGPGGGSYGTVATLPATLRTGEVSHTYGTSDLTQGFFLGSGGGGAVDGLGGKGGGAVYLTGTKLIMGGSAVINANGANGVNATTVNKTGSGGGSGGAVYIGASTSASIGTAQITASGGTGGAKNGTGDDGGTGGSGRIHLVTASLTGTSTPTAVVMTGNTTDGNLVISQGVVSLNQTTMVTATANSAQKFLFVEDTTPFADGDEVIIIQSQGYGAGKWESKIIDGAAIDRPNKKIAVTTNLANYYTAGTSDSSTLNLVTQVVRVPKYTTVTVNSGATLKSRDWDGRAGGILWLRATGAVTIDGTVDMSGYGYRGGFYLGTGASYGGESHIKYCTGLVSSSAPLQGAGAGGQSSNWAAGGGAYGSIAGRTPSGSSDTAHTYGSSDLTQEIHFGSGGGATPSGQGGAGGGIIAIYAATLTVTGTIKSNGQAGIDATTVNYFGSGGGAGGSIYLNVSTTGTLGAGLITATGGAGGLKNGTGATAGTGGTGRIHWDGGGAYTGSSTPTGLIISGNTTNGDLVVSQGTLDLNTPVYVTAANTSAAPTAIVVSSTHPFAVGDEVIVHQSQGYGAGKWEVKTIAAGGVDPINRKLTFTTNLANYYTAGTYDSNSLSAATQVVKLNKYNSVTVNSGTVLRSRDWDGIVGGILAIKSTNAVTVTGSVDMSSYGYRGGFKTTSGNYYGGESYLKFGTGLASVAYAGQGGAAPALTTNWAAGGGGYGSVAGRTPSGSTDIAHTYGSSDLTQEIYFGSGGGSASSGQGGAGGGIIAIYAATLTVTGTIKSNGQAGIDATTVNYFGTGGGAGGAIYLNVSTTGTLGAGLITATGGAGGLKDGTGATGGAGGTGRIHWDGGGAYTGSSSPTGLIISGNTTNGDLVVSQGTLDLNTPVYVTAANTSAAPTAIVVSSTHPFAVGDEVIVHQSQGYGAGKWEVKTIAAGGVDAFNRKLTFTTNLANYYTAGTYDSNSLSAATQVVKLNKYNSVTVNSGAVLRSRDWDGIVGGILAIKSTNAVTVTGSVDMSSYGYRGGVYTISALYNTGESHIRCCVGPGIPVPNSGGGSRGLGTAWAAGGGGYGSVSVRTPSGGSDLSHTYGTSDLTQEIHFGSGGGSNRGAGGGYGGGIVIIYAASLTVTGTIKSNGQAGNDATAASNFDGSGGGAGGAIYLNVSGAGTLGAGLITATGGAGGLKDGTGSTGGTGGTGRIHWDGGGAYTGSSSPTGVIISGNSTNGDLVVSQGTVDLNAPVYGTVASTASGQALITVSSTHPFAVGDEVIVFQTQGTGAGNWEVKTIAAGGVDAFNRRLTFTTNLANTYVSATYDNATNSYATQVVKLHKYNSVTVNAGTVLRSRDWDSMYGGILAIKATNGVSIAGSVDMSSYGFRGGWITVSGNNYQGESYAKIGTTLNTANDGGGGADAAAKSAGGGGYSVAGGNGSVAGAGGATYGNATLTTALHLGSGGGGSNTGSGGHGGGAIAIYADTLTVTGTIKANAENGTTATTTNYNGTGGGAGGSIYMNVTTTGTLGATLVTAVGGSAGLKDGTGRDAGAGGAGRIQQAGTAVYSGSTNP